MQRCLFICIGFLLAVIHSSAATKASVLVLNLAAEGGPGASGYLRKSVPNAVYEALAKTQKFRLLNRDLGARLAKSEGIDPDALADERIVYQLGLAARANLVVFGSFSALGGNARIQLKSFDMAKRKVTETRSQTSPLNNKIFTEINKLASLMARQLANSSLMTQRTPNAKGIAIIDIAKSPGTEKIEKAFKAELFEINDYKWANNKHVQTAIDQSGVNPRKFAPAAAIAITDELKLHKSLIIAPEKNKSIKLSLLDHRTGYILKQQTLNDVNSFNAADFKNSLADPLGMSIGLYSGMAMALDTENGSLGLGWSTQLAASYLLHLTPWLQFDALAAFSSLLQREDSSFLTETNLKIFTPWLGLGAGYRLPINLPLFVHVNLYGGYSYTSLRRSFDTETFTGFSPALRLEIESRYLITRNMALSVQLSYWQVFYSVDSLKQAELNLGARYLL